MMLSDLNAKLCRLDDAVKGIIKCSKESKILPNKSANNLISHKDIYNFKTKKIGYYLNLFEVSFKELKMGLWRLNDEFDAQYGANSPLKESAEDIVLKIQQIEKIKNFSDNSPDKAGNNNEKFEKMRLIIDEMKSICTEIKNNLKNDFSGISGSKRPMIEKTIMFGPSKLPDAIKEEISADMAEIQICFSNKCFRSSIFLCGKILETALHRKFYEVTNRDILETQPGIGLGTLVAKLKEKNIMFDPGITQQMHLINQVRIFSVHKKKEIFVPTKEQAHATILYTIDILNKLFDLK